MALEDAINDVNDTYGKFGHSYIGDSILTMATVVSGRKSEEIDQIYKSFGHSYVGDAILTMATLLSDVSPEEVNSAYKKFGHSYQGDANLVMAALVKDGRIKPEYEKAVAILSTLCVDPDD